MAKVIRTRWVYRVKDRWHRYLPRRNDGVKEFDYEAGGGSLNDFQEEMAYHNDDDNSTAAPSKLWMAWLYRDLAAEPKWTRQRVEKIFGKDYKVGRAEVLKNTEAMNQELWHIKHLIELKPITFPNGEPTADDIHGITLSPDGVCKVVKDAPQLADSELQLIDTKKQWTSKQLSQQLDAKYYGYKDVFEANVYTPSNYVQMK